MRFVCILFVLALSACSIQEATEADLHASNEGYFAGPGVLSGSKGGFSVSEIFSSEKKRKVGGATAYDVDLPAMDQDSFEEYERFKAWRRSQNPGTEEFKEYQEWQEYQKYRGYKLEQGQAK